MRIAMTVVVTIQDIGEYTPDEIAGMVKELLLVGQADAVATTSDAELSDARTEFISKLQIDMSPLEVVTFPESPEGFANFRQAVLDLGFVLTDEEEVMWQERINPQDE